jgi:signal transduction histidine kinase
MLAGATPTVAGEARTAPARLARVWAAIAIALMLLNFVLAVRYVATTGDATSFLSHQLLLPLSTVVYSFLGVAVITHRPANPIGWLFLITGTAYAFTALSAGIIAYGSSLPAVISPTLINLSLWLGNWIWLPATILPTTFVFLLFPDGRLPSSRWRPVAWAVGIGLALIALGLAFHSGPVESWGTGPNPYALAGADVALDYIITLGSLLLLIGGIGSILAILFRYRRSRGIERQQMKWLAYVAIMVVMFMLVTVPVWLSGGLSDAVAQEFNIALTNMVMLLIGIAAAVAIVGYRLYDIDVIINRTLVYGVMTAVILLIYSLIVGAAGVFFGAQGNWLLTLLATGLVAVLFQPIRSRLQQGVNRLLYGQRDEPFEVLIQLGQQLEHTMTPDAIYPAIVLTVATALRLPYVAVEIRQGDTFATAESYGRAIAGTVSLPLTNHGEEVGRLVVGRRSDDEEFSEVEQQLLQNIARQAGAAVYGSKLAADLRRSRQQIVTGREEERRRLRRDLHDGLGPSLASLLLETRALRRLIRDNPAAAEKLADEIQTDIRGTIDEIRRVVHELRPPALDDLGLAPALRVLAAKIGRGEGSADSISLDVQVDAPESLPPLPAAVEVAAYRIVQEALTNVVRHADARCAVVRLWLDHDLHVEVADDGIGAPDRIGVDRGQVGGLGLLSMRERVAELGGTFVITRPATGGTLIRVTLPVAEQ